MSPQLKLQRRDDPLAIRTDSPAAVAQPATATAPAADSPPVTPRAAAHRSPPPRRPAVATDPSERRGRTEPATYDDDRLEQAGWRIYASLLTTVRDRAQQLTDAGVPTSAAALAAATLHSHLPQTVQDGTEVMRAYRQASAGRARARRDA